MQNVLGQFRKPCVLDLKMGTKTWEDSDSEELIMRRKKKFAPMARFGHRFIGMKVS